MLSYLDVSTDLFLAWLYVNYIVYVLVIFIFQGLARYKNLKQRLECDKMSDKRYI